MIVDLKVLLGWEFGGNSTEINSDDEKFALAKNFCQLDTFPRQLSIKVAYIGTDM